MSRSKGRRTLPDNPSLEQLREQAKERLAIIRTHTPESQLSDAQFALARDYGFPGWRALKAEVDRRSGAINGLVGYYAEASVSNNVLSVTAKGGRLFLEIGKGATIEIIPQHDGTFASPGLTRRYQFERDSSGKARAFIIETEAGATVRAARVGAEKAAQMRSARDQAAKAEWRARTSIEVPEDVLERCVGYYANPLGEVMQFSREDRTLFMETVSQTRVALDAESEVDFFVTKARLEFHFRVEADVATSVVFRRLGLAATMSRISPEAAASLRSIVVQRAAEQAQPRQVADPVPPEILARYAGRYRIENGMEIAIEVKDGRIFTQIFFGPAGGSRRLEIFPSRKPSSSGPPWRPKSAFLPMWKEKYPMAFGIRVVI